MAPHPTAPLRRRLCTSAAEAAKPAEGLLAQGQVDAGFFQGTALFAGVILGVQAASEEQRASVLNSMIATYRTFGVSDRITDRQVGEPPARAPRRCCTLSLARPARHS